MGIPNETINPEIRHKAVEIRRVLDVKRERDFRFLQWFIGKSRRFQRTSQLQFVEKTISTPDNDRLRLCIYRSFEPRPKAVGLLWLHGGGFALGLPEQTRGYYRNFIDAIGCVVVAPDYRLSVQAPYPAAFNDCYEALLWMKENADALGIRDDQLFIGGESAGGGLAVSVALMARDKGEVNLAFQMPLYPMLDDRMATPSSQDNDAPIATTKAVAVAWKMYLGGLYGSKDVPAYASPARATDYSGLPPAYTFVGDIEMFCDEAKDYISALNAAGVPAEIDVYPGCFHSFDAVCPDAPVSHEAKEAYLRRLRFAADNYFVAQPD